MAPFDLRDRLIEKIRATGEAAKRGEPARIRIKVNSLADERVIEELYAAGKRGVQVEIVARSICTLRPGVEGLSENIRVLSVLGRYSTQPHVHLRGRRGRCTASEARPVPRHLDHRIEAVVPVEDQRARES